MVSKRTFCRICEAACGLQAEVQGERLISLGADPEHPISKGYACLRGTQYLEVHNSPDRLKYPMKRTARGFARVSWDEALEEIGARMRALIERFGSDAVGMYIGNPAAFSLSHSLGAFGWMRAVGSKNLYSSGSQDCNNKFWVARRMYGVPSIQPVPDIARTRCLIMLGSNPAVSHASFVHLPRPIEQLRAIEKRGGSVWHLNPRRTETAKAVGRHLFIRPGSDVFFLLALLDWVLQRGTLDARTLRHSRGLSQVRALSEKWPKERALPLTGINEKDFEAIADDYVERSHHGTERPGEGAVLYGSTGINQGGQGTLAYWLINVINALSGNLDRAGGALFSEPLFDLPRMMKLAGLGMSEARTRVGGFEAVMDTFPAGTLPQAIQTPGPEQIRAMVVSAGNPLLTCPDESKLEAAMAELELLVCIDMFRNETGNLAHFLLPATSFLERADIPLSSLGFNVEPYLQMTEPVVPADAEQRDEWSIYTALARRLGKPMFGSRLFGTLLALDRLPGVGERLSLTNERLLELLVGASMKTTARALRAHPSGRTLGDAKTGQLPRRILTDDGLIDLAPQTLMETAHDELERFAASERALGPALRLISKRERHSHNSWMHNTQRMVAGDRHTNYLYMTPSDAQSRGLVEGARVRVTSDRGEVEVSLKLSQDLMPNTVALPHGWGHQRADGLKIAQSTSGQNVNRLCAADPTALERYTGMTRLNGLLVQVSLPKTS